MTATKEPCATGAVAAGNKEAALSKTAADPHDFESRLFFQARNLAIEAMLLRLEKRLMQAGFNAQCCWVESSGLRPVVEFRLPNPKPSENSWEYGVCRLVLNRESISAPAHLSQCYYSVHAFERDQYWRGKQPKQLEAFRHAVAALEPEFAGEVAKVNFPFDYQRLSVF